MRRYLITSGPTREYLDPVRFLSNASSGRMGAALADAVLRCGGVPVVVSGPVSMDYPVGTEVHPVETTQEMLETGLRFFPECVGVIGAAAPCDFRPKMFSEQKLRKTKRHDSFSFDFVETPDILAAMGQIKQPNQWSIGFALETEQGLEHALEKLNRKKCDFIVLNSPASIDSDSASVQVFDAAGTLRVSFVGSKKTIARLLLDLVDSRDDSTAARE